MKLVILVVVAETESNKCRCIFQYHSTSAHTYSFILSFISNRRYIILVINNNTEGHTWKLIAFPSGGYTEAVEVNSMVLQPQHRLAITCTFNVITAGCQAVLFRSSLGASILGWFWTFVSD